MPTKKQATKEDVKVSRRVNPDRREEDRRQQSVAVASENRKSTRRKAPRRRQIDPTTCERDYSADEIEFMTALELYKRTAGRMFPTCSEILEVIREIGYVKLSPAEIEARRIHDESAGEETSPEQEDSEMESAPL